MNMRKTAMDKDTGHPSYALSVNLFSIYLKHLDFEQLFIYTFYAFIMRRIRNWTVCSLQLL